MKKGEFIMGSTPGDGGGGVGGTPRKVGWGYVQPTSQNPYPIYDQNL